MEKSMKSLIILFLMSAGLAQDQKPLTHLDTNTPRETQIALAESAAPKSVSGKATIYVLTKTGYEKARTGSNGFTCLVQRDIAGGGTLEPQCYDAVGTATTLQAALFRESERAAGTPEPEIKRKIEEGFKNGKFKVPSKPGLIYMLSDSTYIVDDQTGKVIHVPGHLMFHAPWVTYKDLGLSGPADGPPFLTNPGAADNLMVVIPREKKKESH
jgi:hypothetical protein